MVLNFFRSFVRVFGRDFDAETKKLSRFGRIVWGFLFGMGILLFGKEAIEFFAPPPSVPANVEAVSGGASGIEEDYAERSASGGTDQAIRPRSADTVAARYSVSAGRGLVAEFSVDAPGSIVGWQFYFAFTTTCENDLFGDFLSPAGRRLIVMSRGLGRCSGSAATYSSLNDDDGGAFVGSSGHGEWTFAIRDLDRNGHKASLDALWMTLLVERNGTITSHTVTLDDLPRAIPEPE